MFFSIIIPVYNVGKYIDKCLESIVNQDFDSFEVIVVDDGSTDGSGARCDFYGEKYSFVKVIHQDNAGASAARNAGMDMATGEWIVFVDSDDWIEQSMLRTLYEYMKDEDADLYSYNAYKTDEQGNVKEKLLFSLENCSVGLYSEESRFRYYVDVLMQYKTGWEVWLRVFRRNIICKYNIRFQELTKVFAEDYLFTFQYLLHVKSIVQLCNFFYYYRQRRTSLIHSIDESNVLQRLLWWAESAYDMVKKERLSYFKKNFYVIYFLLINYHLQNMMSRKPDEEIALEMQNLHKNRKHNRWMKQMRKHRAEFLKDMGVKKWL